MVAGFAALSVEQRGWFLVGRGKTLRPIGNKYKFYWEILPHCSNLHIII
jgi:hypothetical protein